MTPQTRQNANNNNSDKAKGSGANRDSNSTGLEVVMEKLVAVQVKIQKHLEGPKNNQATRRTQIMNALAGRRHRNNNDDHDDEETANEDDNSDAKSSQNELPPVDQAARADEVLIKCYNQCKPKEFKGTGGATEAEEWIRTTKWIFKAMNYTDAQRVKLAAFSMHGKAQIWWESKERELATPGEAITWDRFVEEMRSKYVSIVVRDRKAAEFFNLGYFGHLKWKIKFGKP